MLAFIALFVNRYVDTVQVLPCATFNIIPI